MELIQLSRKKKTGFKSVLFSYFPYHGINLTHLMLEHYTYFLMSKVKLVLNLNVLILMHAILINFKTEIITATV